MAWNAERRMAGRPELGRIHEIKGMSYRGALGLGFVVGIFLSLFGLGGGIILVPTFLYFSELPAHAISATSQFAILLTSPPGLITHILQHDVVGARRRAARRRRTARRPHRRAALAAASLAAALDRRRDRARDRRHHARLATAVESGAPG